MAGRPLDDRKRELLAKIRDGRSRLDRTMASLEERIAVAVEVKDRALRYGRMTAIVVGVVAVTLATSFLLRAIVGPRRRRR
jgi:hypothetical protein